MGWCDDYHLPIIVPLSCWLPDPRKTLVMSMSLTSQTTCLRVTANGQQVICATAQSDVLVYQVSSKRLSKTLSGKNRYTCIYITDVCLRNDLVLKIMWCTNKRYQYILSSVFEKCSLLHLLLRRSYFVLNPPYT